MGGTGEGAVAGLEELEHGEAVAKVVGPHGLEDDVLALVLLMHVALKLRQGVEQRRVHGGAREIVILFQETVIGYYDWKGGRRLKYL